MIRLVSFLLTGCWHNWKILEKIDVYYPGKSRPSYFSYHLQCTKCGTVKNKDLG